MTDADAARRAEVHRTALAMAAAAHSGDAAGLVALGERYRQDGGDPWSLAGALAGMAALLAEFYVEQLGVRDETVPLLLGRVADRVVQAP